ncbi:MAG: zinc ribbon domain-containing protein [Candidatus Methanofastidiosia archaeon]|jgi:hypothetical protein
MQCPQCGTKNEEDNTYCKTCGAPLRKKNPEPTTESHKKEVTPSAKKNEVPITFGEMLVSILICGAAGGIIAAVFFPGTGGMCCLWAGLIGGVAVYLSKRFNGIKDKIPTEKALAAGALAGFIAAVIIVGNATVQLQKVDFLGFEEMIEESETSELDERMESGYEMTDEEIEEMLDGFSSIFETGLLMLSFFSVIVYPLFGALGGIIANEITK